MIALRRHEFRGDFEIIADDGSAIGSLSSCGSFWHVRVDSFPAERHSSYDEAAYAAHRLAAEAKAVAA